MFRRKYCVLVLLGVTVLSGGQTSSSAGCLQVVKPAKKKPNILFIAIDDQNDWIGCLEGHPQVKTPNIDRLALQGTLFSNAHCQSPLCNPSRTSLMTGLRPSSTGIYGLAPWIKSLPEFKDYETLPQYFSNKGYTTYTTGKIYHGRNGRGKKDTEFDVVGTASSVGARPKAKLVNTPSEHRLVDWGVFPHQDEDKGDWKVADWAIETLEGPLSENKDDAFFLSVGFFLPHVPCYATQKWFDLYPEGDLILPPIKLGDRQDTPDFSWYLHWKLPEPRLKFLIESNQLANITRSYLASTSFVDSQVGRVLAALEKSGRAEDTIVVLWSDHGFHLGEKEITGKNTLWEESTRVPLIFAGPGVSKGANCREPVELLDIYPTLLELCDFPAKQILEGHSLAPQLADPSQKRDFPAITTHNHDNHSVRSVRYRFIQYADGSEEFYDLQSDPNEWVNLAGRSELSSLIESHRKFLPEENRRPAPGSASRILERINGKVIWEGKEIKPGDPIPEL
ncbi:sulfatase [Mariniblastus sp.]|nr:sulfatase [Mariniblastus sp.]MDA7903782.1 sulfatase [Mariniblastus sp.]MDA7905828.1 sulfatase [Mariniblastus sp.]MDA7928973.1 sulfatase [Mariniblastus sp.]MDB4483724.1 sulfatase [bacterium]